MSETTMGVHITLDADDKASPVVESLRKSVRGLQADMKRAFTMKGTNGGATTAAPRTAFGVGPDVRKAMAFSTRMSRQRQRKARDGEREASRAYTAVMDRMRFQARMGQQRLREEREIERTRRQAEAANLTSLRQRLAFGQRMARQRASEERQDERAHLARVNRLEREQAAARRTIAGRTRDAFGSGRNAVDHLTRGPAVAAAAGVAATGLAARRILTTEADVDAAEVDARTYGNLSKEAARDLRKLWAGPLSEQLGSTTAGLLRSYTEALKVGIPDEGAKAFSELATKTSEAWQVPFGEVVDTLGTVNSILTSAGDAFDFDKLKGVANTMQYLAAKMSTTPEKMISFMQRGAGASQMLGMSQEAGLAFGAASTSLGNQAGSSGRMFDYIAGRITSLPRIMRGHGDDAREAHKMLSALGYGGVAGLQAKQKANPDSFVFDFIDRFNKIRDPKKRNESIRFFAGQEWLGEFVRMVTGSEKVREAQKLAKESKDIDAIGEVWALHQTKLGFVFKQFRAGFLNILGEFGIVLSPIARQVGDYFLKWSHELTSGGLRARFKAALDGFVTGLGFKDVPDLLKGIFGEPGQGSAGAIESWGAFARGFASGIREVADAVVGAFRAMSGGKTDPETIGKWAAEILGFSAALKVASPLIDILKGIGSAILAVWGALSILRTAAGIAGAGVAAGTVGLPVTVFLAGLAGIAALAVTIVNWSAISEAVRDWMFGRKDGQDPVQGSDQPAGSLQLQNDMDAFRLRKPTSAGDDNDLQSLIHRASIDAADDLTGNVRQLGEKFDRFGARLQLASLGQAGADGAASDSTTPGGQRKWWHKVQPMPTRPVLRSGFDDLADRFHPAWMDRIGSPMKGIGGTAMLDAISRAEGTTKDGYNAVLGNGKYGRPDKPLTEMTLDEAFRFGRTVMARHGSSSALGRYQIVGNTMMDAARALGMDSGSTKFDGETQDRMAKWIARKQGLGAWEGFKTNPGERAAASADIARSKAASIGFDTDPTNIADRLRAVRASGLLSNQQCVTLAKAYVGASGSVTDWRKGDSAESGGLKPGTPVATFLNRDGSQSGRYAGGGTGTMGAHLDHAGVFQSYIRDAAGKAIGMNLLEQFQGSNGQHMKRYKFGQGWGEGNGSNYFAIKGANGAYLGGANNPMNAQGLAGGVPTPESISRDVPTPPSRPGAGGSAQGGGSAPVVHMTVNGANQSPTELAGALQRRITESWNLRAHDLEPELT